MLQFVPKSMWGVPRRRLSSSAIRLKVGDCLTVQDSIEVDLDRDKDADVLKQVAWKPECFSVTASQDGDADLSLNFPSPRPQGNPHWDTAILDWHFARDKSGEVKTAPAVVVLDILQGGNLVAGYIARNLAKRGLHGFVLHLPQTGRRLKPGAEHDWSAFLPSLRQGASDARRARDVVAALPMVEGGVSLQGTSLGGFVATLAGSIDGCFDTNILALTGADVYGILSKGKMDAARVRQHLRDAGYTDAKLKDWLWQIEPLRVAHRLKPSRTWLFSAKYDQVVPARHGKMLADKIDLKFNHRRYLTGCHYTCVINANRFMQEITRAVVGG